MEPALFNMYAIITIDKIIYTEITMFAILWLVSFLALAETNGYISIYAPPLCIESSRAAHSSVAHTVNEAFKMAPQYTTDLFCQCYFANYL